MTNRLVNENSPYLLQHAENPVDWYPWGDEALERARREDMPIFLSIGYAACHWCHVMAHESFEDEATAALMNENFINIKVDREERPDLDSIYMSAVVAMAGQGGWPMSVFLTPEGEPFFGGTYFPPVRRYNMPSFREVLVSVARLWREDRSQLLQSGKEIALHLQSTQTPDLAYQPLQAATLDQAAFRLAQTYDWKHGGWGKAPKFPQPMAIEFLLRRAGRGDQMALDIALHALDAMKRGGMYDVVGGGFSRYSTDDRWLVPHFEKMLYDNAQLAKVYLQAYMLTRKPAYRQVCEETLDFLAGELLDPSGGFFSSLDADSEGEEGKYYVWSLDEFHSALQTEDKPGLQPDLYPFFLSAYNIQDAGNFEGQTVLQRGPSDEELASQYNLSVEQVRTLLSEIRARLFAARAHRIRPGTDDKVLVAWNALTLKTLAEAARYLQRTDYLAFARKTAAFILDELYQDGVLYRSWRRGRARHQAYLEDYAALILALLALYQTDPDLRWYRSAMTLTQEMLEHFTDPQGGFYDTSDMHAPLLLRPKDLQDNATPSGNALAARALIEIVHYSGRGSWRDLAEGMLGRIQTVAARHPTAFGLWLTTLDQAISPAREVAILGDDRSEDTQDLIRVLWSRYRTDTLAAISPFPASEDAPELLRDRPLLNGRATAYVCQNFVCQRPVNSPQELQSQLD